MKELTIEEKAKRYDEALIRGSKLWESDMITRENYEYIFPEVKESENKRMIQYFKDLAPFDKADELYEKYGFSHKDAIAWLERQVEHANFRNKIQVGDKVTRNEDGVLVNLSQLARVAKPAKNQDVQQETLCGKCRKEQPSHSCQDITALGRCAVEHEQKPTEFDDANAKRMFIKALERVEEQNNKGYKLTDCDKNSWWEDFKAYCGYTEIQKSVWSEEDEEIYRKCICAMRASACGFPEEEKFVEQVDNWLKSLKERYTWKPSDEQMDTLEYYMHTLICNEHKEVLFGLYADLKKLKE